MPTLGMRGSNYSVLPAETRSWRHPLIDYVSFSLSREESHVASLEGEDEPSSLTENHELLELEGNPL